jgi:hypothetical protein
VVWSICWDLAFGEGRSRDGGSEPIVWLWLDREREREGFGNNWLSWSWGGICRGGCVKYCYCRYSFTRQEGMIWTPVSVERSWVGIFVPNGRFILFYLFIYFKGGGGVTMCVDFCSF